MKFLKFLLILISFSSCQSVLNVAGERHALTFKKWQALSLYSQNSYLSNYPKLYLVGELTVDSNGENKEFKLTNIKFSYTETVFQINLLHPKFESKYICDPQCFQLTEYFEQESTANTMLTRYFDQQEFSLFKLYGEIFSLDETIHEKIAISPENFDAYMNWLMKNKSSSPDIEAFMANLKQTFSEKSYIAFMNQPRLLYSHLTEENKASKYAALYLDAMIETPDEKLILGINNFEEKQSSQQASNLELGDLVCNSVYSKFGSVTEIQGKNITVELIGNILMFSDGLYIETNSNNMFNSSIDKTFTLIDKTTKTYTRSELSKCNLELS